MNKTNVNIIRVFEGRRHDRLRFLWDVIAENQAKKAILHWFPNPRMASHASCLESMWQAERGRPGRYALFTEHDFLPDLKNWLPTALLSADEPVLASRYVTRDQNTRKVQGHDGVGPWYVLVDKQHAPADLHWEPWGPFNDPANGLDHFLQKDHGKRVRYLSFRDSMPFHYGITIPTGEHLFWARHLHDHENLRIGGVCMGDMQRKHDEAVMAWVRRTPNDYRKLLRRRLEQYQALAGSNDDPAQEGSLYTPDCLPAEPTL